MALDGGRHLPAAAPTYGCESLGLAITDVQIERLTLPDELQRRLDERIGMAVVGDLGRYTQFQTARSIPLAAAAEGGGGAAGAGVGVGAGVAMGEAMGANVPVHVLSVVDAACRKALAGVALKFEATTLKEQQRRPKLRMRSVDPADFPRTVDCDDIEKLRATAQAKIE